MTGCSACRTASRRWSSTTTPRWSTSTGCATAAWMLPTRMRPAGPSTSSRRPPSSRAVPPAAKGVHIAPTLAGLSPFIESGGGSVFDDDDDPKSLAFSSDDSKSALERTLELLRRPQVTLDENQLASASPLKWFIRGKLGMIAGYRSLVPQLRLIPGLNFDVMPMPVLDSSATVGDVTGLCLSRDGGQHRGGRRLHGPRARRRLGRDGDPHRLPRPGQPRGRADRRLPAAGPPARARQRLQQQRPLDAVLAADRHHLGARGDRAARASRSSCTASACSTSMPSPRRSTTSRRPSWTRSRSRRRRQTRRVPRTS